VGGLWVDSKGRRVGWVPWVGGVRIDGYVRATVWEPAVVVGRGFVLPFLLVLVQCSLGQWAAAGVGVRSWERARVAIQLLQTTGGGAVVGHRACSSWLHALALGPTACLVRESPLLLPQHTAGV